MAYKPKYWDSRREYENFWGHSGSAPYQGNPHKDKRHSYGWIALLLIIALIVVVAAGIGLFVRGQSGQTNGMSLSVVDSSPDEIPEFSGSDYVILNDNIPGFNDLDLQTIVGESFSELDRLGRCGTAVAMIDHSMMPTEERGEIGQIKPSGWNQAKYEGYVDSKPPYLYNRCHLIAYALTGQNANELNLITGTRYFNVNAMLPFEEEVMKYLDTSDNHVLYRVSPYFKGDELLARGVEMEAYSVEDHGEGVSYHVFVYNQQPGIEINYATGVSGIQKKNG